jgi:hypothetical protein
MMEWITFGLIVAKIVLDFVASRTKNKVDDAARDFLNKLPSMPAKSPEASARKVEGFSTDAKR